MTQDNAFRSRRSVPTLLVTAGLVLTVLLPGAVAAQDADPRARYQTCLVAARTAPAETYESAREWEVDGGGNLARHCWAMALWHQEKWPEAARALDDLARETAALAPPFAARFLPAAAGGGGGAVPRPRPSAAGRWLRWRPPLASRPRPQAPSSGGAGRLGGRPIAPLRRALEQQAPAEPHLLAARRACGVPHILGPSPPWTTWNGRWSRRAERPEGPAERGLILTSRADREGAAPRLAPGRRTRPAAPRARPPRLPPSISAVR